MTAQGSCTGTVLTQQYLLCGTLITMGLASTLPPFEYVSTFTLLAEQPYF